MKITPFNNQRGFVHILILLIVIAGVAGLGFFAYQKAQESKQANSTTNLPGTPNTANLPSVVKAVEFSTKVDSIGKATASTAVFTPTDGKINVVSTLQNPKKSTKIEFVRYRDDKFIDNGSLTIAKDGAQYASFDFTPKPGKQHPAGSYKVKIYADGKYQTSGTYSIK